MALAAVPAFAATTSVNVPKKFAKITPRVSEKSGLDVLLPDKLNSSVKKTYPTGSATKSRYELILGAGPKCNGANVCLVAYFSGERGGKPSYKRKVSLINKMTGYYKPLTCGASCSAPTIQWRQNGALYEIQAKETGKRAKRTMIGLANSAIRFGRR